MSRDKRGYRRRYGMYVSYEDCMKEWAKGMSALRRDGKEKDFRRFKNVSHSCDLRAELVSQRETGEFVDVVVEIEGRKFHCHRAVLASVPYFKTMLSCNLVESNSRVIQLGGIVSSSFSKILDFVYMGEICIGVEDVQNILQAAHMLQFDKILKYCEGFIQENLCPSNCVGVMLLADMYGFLDLKEKARKEVLSNFSDIRQSEDFLSLPTEELLDLLKDDDLQVMSEEDIVHSVIRWLEHDPENRKTAISEMLPLIRLPYLRVSLLKTLESHPLVRQSAESLSAITAEKKTRQLYAGTEEEDGTKTKPRRGTSDDLAIIVGGWKAVHRKPLIKPRTWRLVPWTRASIQAAFNSGMHKRPERDKPATVDPPASTETDCSPITSSTADANLHRQIDSPEQPIPDPVQSIICLDPNARQYYHITDLPMPTLGYMSVAMAKGRLYVSGGRVQPLVGEGPHTAPIKQASCYDFLTDTWAELPDLPRGRAEHQSVVVDGKLFLVGGDTEEMSSFSMDCYDLEEGVWMKPPTAPATPTIDPSSSLTVAGRGGTIVVIEATTDIEERRKKRRKFLPIMVMYRKLCVHALDIKGQHWTSLELRLDTAKATVEPPLVFVIAVDDMFYFFSTEIYRYNELYDPTMYVYDAKTKTLRTDVEDELGFAGHFLRTKRTECCNWYASGQEGIADMIVNPKIEGKDSTVSWQTSLPVALFGHGFLLTKKSDVGWYCRDLKKVDKDDKTVKGTL